MDTTQQRDRQKQKGPLSLDLNTAKNSDGSPYPTIQDKYINLPKSEINGFFIICHTQNISKGWNYRATATRVYRVQEWDQLEEKKKTKSELGQSHMPWELNKLKIQEGKGLFNRKPCLY